MPQTDYEMFSTGDPVADQWNDEHVHLYVVAIDGVTVFHRHTGEAIAVATSHENARLVEKGLNDDDEMYGSS